MTKIESGRSMVEMLGVLAIIGVLSIGGIAGYTMAMNRHKANTIADFATRMAIVGQTYAGTGVDKTGMDAANLGLETPYAGSLVSSATVAQNAAHDNQYDVTLTYTGSDGTLGNAVKTLTGSSSATTITYGESGIVPTSAS